MNLRINTDDGETWYFDCPDHRRGYVYVTTPSGHRTQPCEGGGFLGVTLIADAASLRKVARRWLRQHTGERWPTAKGK